MKTSARAVIPAFFLLLLGNAAGATDAKNGYLILGPGAYSCRQVVAEMARDAKNNNAASIVTYSNWLAGSLTAYNRATKGTYSILGDSPFKEAFAWVIQYCSDHPDAIYASATDALIAKLKPHRYAAMPEPVEKEKGDEDDDDDDKDDKKDNN